MASLSPSRSIRFLIAGAINTLFGLALYPLMVWNIPLLHRHYFAGLLIAQAICVLFAYGVYKFGVFRTRGQIPREFRDFSSFYVVNYAANWASLPLMVEVGGISPVVAQTGFTCIVIVGSWFWHTRITFRSGEKLQ